MSGSARRCAVLCALCVLAACAGHGDAGRTAPATEPAGPPSIRGEATAPEGHATAARVGAPASVAATVAECWSAEGIVGHGAGATAELRAEVDATGRVRGVRPSAGASPRDPAARAVYGAARRALLDPRCNPLPLPRDGRGAPATLTLRFTERGPAAR